MNFLSFLNPFSDNFILKGVLEFLGSILDYINPFSDNFILKTVVNFLGSILNFINPFHENFIGYKFIELLKELFVFLFVPSQDSFELIPSIFNDKFSFISDIQNYITSVFNMFDTVEGAPIFKINVDSKYYSGELTVIDLNFYKPYKAYGDMVITALVYLFFIWRVFARLSNTISGVSSSQGSIIVQQERGVK